MPPALTGRAGAVWLQAGLTRHALLASGASPSTGVAAGQTPHLATSPDAVCKRHTLHGLGGCNAVFDRQLHTACMSAMHVGLPAAAVG